MCCVCCVVCVVYVVYVVYVNIVCVVCVYKYLILMTRSKVKGSSPPVLVKISDQIVVHVGEVGVTFNPFIELIVSSVHAKVFG